MLINIDVIFIWIGNPNNCLRLNRRPQAFASFKNKCLFQKGVFWSTQALFTAEQAAAGALVFLKNDMPL